MKLGCWVSSNYPSTVHSASWWISFKKYDHQIFNLNHLYSHNESLKRNRWTSVLDNFSANEMNGNEPAMWHSTWKNDVIPKNHSPTELVSQSVQLILHVKRAPTRGFDPLRPRFHRCSEGPTLWGSSDSFGHPHANRPPNRDVRSTCPESEGCGPFSIILLAYRLFRWCSRVVSLWDLGEHKATRSGEVSW